MSFFLIMTKQPRRPRARSVLIFEGNITVGSLRGVIGVRGGPSSKKQKCDQVTIIRGNITANEIPEDATIGRDYRSHSVSPFVSVSPKGETETETAMVSFTSAEINVTPFQLRGPLIESPKQKEKKDIKQLRKRVKAMDI